MRAKPKRLSYEKIQILGLVIVVSFFSLGHWMFLSKQFWPWSEQPLKIWMLDIGQGDALLIEFPTGEQMLVDGGPGDFVLAKLGSVLAPWDRSLDAVVVTHPDADHVSGIISVLDRYDVITIYESGVGANTPFGKAYEERRDDENSEVTQISNGDVIKIGQVTLTILWPEQTQEEQYPNKRNDVSLVFLLEYGQTSVLFTADTEQEAEDDYASRVGDVDILKVGHHGSLTSTSWNLLELTDPEFALVSLGEDNPYGHPHPVILDRLDQVGAKIFRTDLDGDILLTSYGDEPAIESHPLLF